MGNVLGMVASSVGHLLAYLVGWNTNENCQEEANVDVQDLSRLLEEAKEEKDTLESEVDQLCLRNDELQRLLSEKEQEIGMLKRDCNHLRTRLSEMGAMQLTEGNPNIADLSDQNRPDKIAEQFSELYDNQWTDCYQVLVDVLKKTEQETVQTLLMILKTAYDISLDRSQDTMRVAKKVLLELAGKSDGKPKKALETLIQETLHKMKSYRTQNFTAAPTDIAKVINEKLLETIGQQEITLCSEYIEACVRICWLICIKDPPMYIFCEKEDVFDKNHFREYTEIGHKVSYVVWPALYLYHNGPLMRKGVAQGEAERKQNENSKVDTDEDGPYESADSFGKESQPSTQTKEMFQHDEDDYQETESSQAKEHNLEGMPITDNSTSPNTLERISDEETIAKQKVVNKDVYTIAAEGDSTIRPSNKVEDMSTTEAVDADVQRQYQDIKSPLIENHTLLDSSLQGGIEEHDNSVEGNAETFNGIEQPEQSEQTATGIECLKIHKNGVEEECKQKQEEWNETEELHTSGRMFATDKEDQRSCGNKEAKHKIAWKDEASEQVESRNTDTSCSVQNTEDLYKIDNQSYSTSSLADGVERQADESGKQQNMGVDMQQLTLTVNHAVTEQSIIENPCFIDEHGKDVIKKDQEGETEMIDLDGIRTVEDEESQGEETHVENVLLSLHASVNAFRPEEHEHELSNFSGNHCNDSSHSKNYGDDSTYEVEQKSIVETGIAVGGKVQEENGGKQSDVVKLIHSNEMEPGKETNKIFLLTNKNHKNGSAIDSDALYSCDERGEEREDDIVSPSDDKNRPEVYIEEDESVGVSDFCNLTESIQRGEKGDGNNQDLAVDMEDDAVNPSVVSSNETHQQRKITEDTSVEGQGEK